MGDISGGCAHSSSYRRDEEYKRGVCDLPVLSDGLRTSFCWGLCCLFEVRFSQVAPLSSSEPVGQGSVQGSVQEVDAGLFG